MPSASAGTTAVDGFLAAHDAAVAGPARACGRASDETAAVRGARRLAHAKAWATPSGGGLAGLGRTARRRARRRGRARRVHQPRRQRRPDARRPGAADPGRRSPCGPDIVSVVIGVNDTLRCTFDIHAVAARLDQVYAAFRARDAVVLTACLPDPGAMLGLPGALARPLARRQRAVNAVVHALSERYGAVHLHAAEEEWLTDRAMWSADRLHPGERGHRQLARPLPRAARRSRASRPGPRPRPSPSSPRPPGRRACWWLATAGTGWVARRCTDLLPQLLTLAASEVRHRARGTSARLDLSASHAAASALAALSGTDAAGRGLSGPVTGAGQRRRTATNRTGVPGTAWAAAGRSAGPDDRDHRVAAGGRVVGEEDHRPAVRRHLHRAQHHALAGQFAGPGPLQRRALPCAGRCGCSPGDTRYGAGGERAQRPRP